jgi:hypothetical protein
LNSSETRREDPKLNFGYPKFSFGLQGIKKMFKEEIEKRG